MVPALCLLLTLTRDTAYFAPGSYVVESKVLTLHDSGRNKDLNVRVSWPAGKGVFPVILFSHGYMGSENGYQPLVRHWVSHGFIVIQPRHFDSVEGKSTIEKLRAASFRDPKTFGSPLERIKDLEFLQTQIKSLAPNADLNHVGVSGHSYGGMTTSIAAGTSLKGIQAKMKGITAFIMLSPGGGTGKGQQDYSGIVAPSLVVSGTLDTIGQRGIMPEATPESRKNPFLYSPPGDKFLLWMIGAHHDLGGISGAKYRGSGEENSTMLSAVLGSTTAFWKAYLGNDPAAKRFLEKGSVTRLDPKIITWASR